MEQIGKYNLSGKRVGNWLVTEETIVEHGRRKWKCICKCGTERYVNEQNLRSEKSRSCGCSLTKSSSGTKVKDLTGQTFGLLTVMERGNKNKNGRICWICRCECGKTTLTAGHDLVSGKTKSCGCLRKKARNTVDLKGEKFGRLMVQRATEQRSYKGCIIWHCQCECGQELDLASDDLTSGRYVSCGCKRREYQKNIHETLHRIDHTCIEYLEKRTHRCDNTSGRQGVQCIKNGKYRAFIGFQGKKYHLGYYDSFRAAVAAREEAENKLHKAYVRKYHEWQEKAEGDPKWAKENPLVFDVEINH